MIAPLMPPHITVIAGPNGAGKSTAAARLLKPGLPFLNADEIAKTLEPGRNIEAGKLWLAELDRLEARRESFALETTLAGRSLAKRLAELKASGYHIAIYFFWLPNAELAIERVADRVRRGGHDIPEDVVRRRYAAGLKNFVHLYAPLANNWFVAETADPGVIRLMAARDSNGIARAPNAAAWPDLYTITRNETG